MAMTTDDDEKQFGNFMLSRESKRHGVIRHIVVDKEVNPTFYEFQCMKNMIFGGDKAAVEIFPKNRDLFDGQNQRHLWMINPIEFPEDTYQVR